MNDIPTRKADQQEIEQAITVGMVFKGKPKSDKAQKQGVKTKAKKKKYITGSHGSGSAKMKSKIREKRANRSR